MWWPVLVGIVPMAEPWSVGDQVSVPLRWRDDPGLPDDLQLREIPMRARLMPGSDEEWFAQLLESGGVTAARPGHRQTGKVRMTGCLEYDLLSAWEQVPKTTGTIRRIRVVHDLHDRGETFWDQVPGAHRLLDVEATAPHHLRDDPPDFEAEPSDEEPDPSTLRLFGAHEFYALFRDHLPPQQWQATGFLVDLDVP